MALNKNIYSGYVNSSYQKKSEVKALLGPTNTGKTFYSMERMLGHKSGIIGFP